MGALKAVDHIYSVGVVDKNLRVFDAIMPLDHGTTYNSYIVRTGEKTVLFETVKTPFCEAFLANIQEVCPLDAIDYIVISHTEPDHSGCLETLLQHATNATVLAGSTAISFLQEIVNRPIPHRVVNEGDVIDIGGATLHFYSVPMLHWPDTIFTYIPELKALFSCDCFGCHYGDDAIFNDLVGDKCSFEKDYKYYFDTILAPYMVPHMGNALDKIQGLEIEFIGNGHGPVIRRDAGKYLEIYRTWAQPDSEYPKSVAVAYVSAYGYTTSLAWAIIEGLREGGVTQVDVFNLSSAKMETVQATLASAQGILLGSATLMGDALPPVYEAMLGLNPVLHKGRLAGAFGCYGWSGEAVPNITARLQQLRMSLPLEGLRVRFRPSAEELEAGRQYGIQFAEALLGH